MRGPDGEYERLLRFLTWPEPGFALAVARCDGSDTSRALQASAIADAARRGARIGVVDLEAAEPDVDVIDAMVAALGEEVDALFVTGMGQLAVDLLGAPRITAAIARLNQARDALPRRISQHVVLWLSSRQIAGLAEVAPDTWDIVRSVFLLAGTQAELAAIPVHRRVPDWMQVVGERDAERLEQQVGLLQELHNKAKPGTIAAADIAVSLANLELGLARGPRALEWLERAALAYEEAGQPARAVDARRRRALAMQQYGWIDEARAELDQARQLARDSASTVELVMVLLVDAEILTDGGEVDSALALLVDEAKPQAEATGDELLLAEVWGRVGDILDLRGELDEALKIRQERELPVYQRLGDVRAEALTWGRIGDILTLRGELDEALKIRQERELPVYQRLGDLRSEAVTWGQIGDIVEARGELDEALAIWTQQVLPAYERLGARRDLVPRRTKVAMAYSTRNASGDRERAAELLRLALADAERMHMPEADEIRRHMTSIGIS